MKNIIFPAIIMALLAFGSVPSKAQKSAKKDAQFKEMVTLIEGGNYKFQVQSVSPTGGRTIHPTSVYTLVAKEASFKADLPYFGRAYQASYGGDGGISFDGEPEKVEIVKNEKKRSINVMFEIQGDNDRYNIILQVGFKGYGNLSITCQRRQAISYYGLVSPSE